MLPRGKIGALMALRQLMIPSPDLPRDRAAPEQVIIGLRLRISAQSTSYHFISTNFLEPGTSGQGFISYRPEESADLFGSRAVPKEGENASLSLVLNPLAIQDTREGGR